jgi:hypothetical protein
MQVQGNELRKTSFDLLEDLVVDGPSLLKVSYLAKGAISSATLFRLEQLATV